MEQQEYRKPDWKRIGAVVGLIVCIVAVAGAFSFWAGTFHGIYVSDTLGLNEPNSRDIRVYDNVKVFVNGMLVYEGHNQIQNDGRTTICHYLAEQAWVNSNATTNAWHWIAIGTGSGQGVSANTLATEFDRQIGTDAYPSAYNFTITYTWTAGAFDGDTISECGLFNAASGGIMFNYHDFTGITLQTTDSLQVQIEVQVGS